MSETDTNSQDVAPRPRIGLALGSGVARGWTHIGVIRALVDHDIIPDVVAGTSIGAMVGGAYLSGKLDSLADWATSLTRMRMLRFLDIPFRGGGIIAGDRLRAAVREHFGDVTFEDLRAPLACVATELDTGHEVWLRTGLLIDAMEASYALPGMFTPVSIGGRWFVDGALVNPVPISVCRAMGARLVISVNPNADQFGKFARRASSNSGNGQSATDETASFNVQPLPTGGIIDRPRNLLMRGIFGREARKPSMFDVMVSSLTIIQDRLARSRLAGDPPDVAISPRIGHIGMLEFARAQEAIDIGYEAGSQAIGTIRDAMAVLA